MQTRICGGVVHPGEDIGISVQKVQEAIDAMVLRFLRGQPIGVPRKVFVALVMCTDGCDDAIDTEGEAVRLSLPPRAA
jgi:hypothetical protein